MDTKCCVQVLKLLDDTIVDTTDYGQKHKDFDELQFELFDIARKQGLNYATCREIVEWTCQLLFSLGDLGIDSTLEALQRLRMNMYDDLHPLEIRSDVVMHLRPAIKKADINDALIIDCIEKFIQAFSVKKQDNSIIYL